ncbi:hypothetical protein SAMN04487831_105152 [Pseudobutyrivibrio sp. UC1225]|uniref:hypothetical protein n=1 Tax=Pseudobutyrivibrio sp. UC1225 TaxID=1798185 RepID=UPI0008E2003A|nr:hypothetical protein [Pseudobutyrivibrio sp. UC1225]SFN95860.1 hypothetical protein SAMN04487831_105152 [Pseudobutyrivibrio sp. UC1225]
MNKSFNRKVIIGVILVIAALCFVQSLYHVDIYFEKKSNHEKVTELINNDLVFSWDTMDDELSQILDWIDSGHFYNGDLGRLYERASLIYMQKGEPMSYYRYLGYALFYLEQSDDKDYTVNIYLDQSHTNIYEETYRAINDAWLARVYVETGRFDECREKLDKWEGHDMCSTRTFIVR